MKIRNLDLGDIQVEDSGQLGLDFYHVDGEKIMFLNAASELALLEFLQRKYSKKKSTNVGEPPRRIE